MLFIITVVRKPRIRWLEIGENVFIFFKAAAFKYAHLDAYTKNKALDMEQKRDKDQCVCVCG